MKKKLTLESGNMRTEEMSGANVLTRVPDYLKCEVINSNDKIVEFDSLRQYKNFMIEHKDFKECTRQSSMNEGSWSGSYTYDDFLTILDEGDEDVMSKIKLATGKEVNELKKKYEEVIHGFKFDVTGHFFDVGLVLTGVPEAWLEPDYEEEEKVQVELLINGSFSANVNKDRIVRSASRILAMAKILEENDVQVKIRIISSNDGSNGKYGRGSKLYVSTMVKDFDEPINYKKVGALLSPTYHRRGTFKVIELDAGYEIGRGYGRPIKSSNFIQLDDRNRGLDRLEEKLFKGGL